MRDIDNTHQSNISQRNQRFSLKYKDSKCGQAKKEHEASAFSAHHTVVCSEMTEIFLKSPAAVLRTKYVITESTFTHLH